MPVQLSQKERMLLQDQQHHEQLCVQKYNKYANETQCSELKQLFQTHSSHEQQHYNTISQILSGQIPNMNQGQQNQAMQAQQKMNTMQSQAGSTGYNQNDASLANDMLTTEKYISGTYDTAIFECRDTNIRQALNHIQKDEQQHGEDLYNYMQAHGMYNTQS
ncbi:spore coat protein [Desulfitobacterium metallireducens]|uniref:Coat F domain protein n=1 Tax=Desulfitobacterium metallireducens DSM 15288 TaxID=871968 RepID=W0ECQ7_9FIRM|nr:spore coat protein [Desulfitobacterium metallireducens]AHF06851.1 Coat F domain protein [Desulfitobacterium metallireducens DSM 15288]